MASEDHNAGDAQLTVAERIQNVKTEYDLSIDDHATGDCQLCGDETTDVEEVEIENEADGRRTFADLCADCREEYDV